MLAISTSLAALASSISTMANGQAHQRTNLVGFIFRGLNGRGRATSLSASAPVESSPEAFLCPAARSPTMRLWILHLTAKALGLLVRVEGTPYGAAPTNYEPRSSAIPRNHNCTNSTSS